MPDTPVDSATLLKPQQPAPEDYYQNNCVTLLEFVQQRYLDLLDRSVLGTVEAYLGAGDDAQRLFVRLLTRKGPLFRIDSLNYREVRSTHAAIEELVDAGLVAVSPDAPGDRVLALLRKTELCETFAPALHGRRNETKPSLVARVLGTQSDRRINQIVKMRVPWLTIARSTDWQVLQLLYFGDGSSDLSQFVMRDLGMVAYESVALSERRFVSRTDLASELTLRHLAQLSHRLDERAGLGVELREALTRELTEDAPRLLRRRRDKALLRTAQWFESAHQFEHALTTYDAVSMHPARERKVRTLKKLGRADAAQAVLEQIRLAPWCEEETQFAQRFGQRNGGFTPKTDTLEIAAVQASVEGQALDLLLEQGARWGAHVENGLILSLTGLAYWDAVFAPLPGAFTNPFQSGPLDLYEADFCTVRGRYLAAVESLTDRDFGGHLVENFQAKTGISNALVNWPLLHELGMTEILEAMPIGDIRKICAFLIRHLASRRRGLPDLFVAYGPGCYELVEVKGPNDQLQPGQRAWFVQLDKLSIPARVLKLKLGQAPPGR